MTTRDRVQLAVLLEGRESGYYPRRSVRAEMEIKRAPMRPAGVRKMRQSRKRRKGE